MKIVEDYQKLRNLTDKEYIYLLEGFYFHGNDRIKKIINQKGYCAVVIPDNPRYALYFKDAKRISKDQWDSFLDSCNILPSCF